MIKNDLNLFYMNLALELAKVKSGDFVSNPSVGAVIVFGNSKIIGHGYHNGVGEKHAEVVAVESVKHSDKHYLPFSKMYVTLEPCCHYGFTPPCVYKILNSEIKTVYYGYKDPNPIVSGVGDKFLNDNGVNCIKLDINSINDFYKGYDFWVKTGTPFTSLKMAFSLDGKISYPDKTPAAITNSRLKKITYLNRKYANAILTSVNTVCNDNPYMKGVDSKGNEVKKTVYILDLKLDTPLSARIFNTAKRIIIFYSENCKNNLTNKISDFLKLSCVELRPVPCLSREDCLKFILSSIGKDGVHRLWVEVGLTLFSNFIKYNLPNEVILYVGNKHLGCDSYGLSESFDLWFTNYKVKNYIFINKNAFIHLTKTS